MKLLPIQANIVVLASNHNPGIVSKEWLSQKKIFTDMPNNFIHTPDFSLVETENFSLHIDPQRLNISIKSPNEDMIARLPFIAAKYVEALPETPYRAVGLNSNWLIQQESPDLLKGIFLTHPSQLDIIFPDKPYNIGGIVSYEYNPFNLQLTIKPDKDDNIRFDFNYHSNVSDANELGGRISRFADTIEHARSVVSNLLGGE